MIGPSGGGGFPIPGWLLLLMLSAVVFAALVKMVWGRRRSGLALFDRRVALAVVALLGSLVWYRVESEPRWHIRAVAGDVESVVESAGVDLERRQMVSSARAICVDRRISRGPSIGFKGVFGEGVTEGAGYRVELERVAVAFADDGWEVFRFARENGGVSLIARRDEDVAAFYSLMPESYTATVQAEECSYEGMRSNAVSALNMSEVSSFTE